MKDPQSRKEVLVSALWLGLKIAIVVVLMHFGKTAFVYQGF
jgi:hypothetical protein